MKRMLHSLPAQFDDMAGRIEVGEPAQIGLLTNKTSFLWLPQVCSPKLLATLHLQMVASSMRQ